MFKALIMTALFISYITNIHAESRNEIIQRIKAAIAQTERLNPKVQQFAVEVAQAFSANKEFIKAVKQQNAKETPLTEIQKIDKEWQEAEDELPIHEEMLGNSCALEVKKQIANYPQIVEAFIMDNQGANVGQNDLTSDYWQGDETKWTASFKNGIGGFYAGKEEFDKSANALLQQLAFPIIDDDGAVIGAICIGVNVSKL